MTAGKRIASVDAVKGQIIHATLSSEARGTPVKGMYVVLKSGEEIILGRVISVNLTNPVHQDDVFAPYIMVEGFVPYWSKDVDIERAEIEVLAIRDIDSNKRVPWRRNPASGTFIYGASSDAASPEAIDRFLNERGDYIVVVGEIPNSGGIPATMINRNFGPYSRKLPNGQVVDAGGYGEARHAVVVGQNGSGKTIFALMIIVGKLAAHPQMGLLMPDTAGDLSKTEGHFGKDFQWNYLEALKAARVDVETIDIEDIRLTSLDTLKAKLRPLLRERLSMGGDKPEVLASLIVEGMFDDEVDISKLTSDAVIDAIITKIQLCYDQKGKAEKIKELTSDVSWRKLFDRGLRGIYKLFDGRVELRGLIRDILIGGRKVVIRMDESRIDREDQDFVMLELMRELARRSRIIYKSGGMCNALVALDEGSRWVPEGTSSDGGDADKISSIVRTSFLETRKYGVGSLVISQRPSGISKVVLTQAHNKFFGRGLNMGNDARHLEDCIGKSGVEFYEQLQMQGGFPWIGVGLDNNLGTEGSYFAFYPFGGDATKAFIEANPQIFNKSV
jgi:hypothetical protein